VDTVIIFGAKYLFLALPALFLLALYQANHRDRKRLIMALIAAIIIAGILDKLGGHFYYDPRPFVTHHVTPLVAHSADNGFPSEHTLFSFTFATVILLYRKRLGWLAVLLGLLVGAARIAAHVHSPIDIAGGVVFGVAAAYAGKYLTEKYAL
jgi:undecaprenyl-diphosphatase